MLEKLSYVDVNSRLKTITTIKEVFTTVNNTLKNTFAHNEPYLDMIHHKYTGKLTNIGKLNDEMKKCISEIEELYTKAPFIYDKLKIEAQHNFEREEIFRKIFSEIHNEARQAIDNIASETMQFGIDNDCELEPVCRSRIEEKITEIDQTYENIAETTKVLFIEQENNYKERVQDYLAVLEKSMKPYHLLADQCLQKHLRNNNEEENLIH